MSYRLRVRSQLGPVVVEVQVPELVDEDARFDTEEAVLERIAKIQANPRWAIAGLQMGFCGLMLDYVEAK